MIYIILGAILMAMAALSQAGKITKTITMGIGALLIGSFTGMAATCSNGGNFSKDKADIAYDYAIYIGNDAYDTRNWGTIRVKVENPDKIPVEGQQVYIYRYYNADEPLDLLVAPWRLFKERWYL